VHTSVKEGVSAPKTLSSAREELVSAREEIERLQRQIFESRTVQSKLTDDTPPLSSAPGRVSAPGAGSSGAAGVQLPEIDAQLPPVRLKMLLQNLSDQELRSLLERECSRNRKTQNSKFISQIYHELKSRSRNP
jgi:hypothetical protein